MANWFVAVPWPATWLNRVLQDLPPSCRGFSVEDIHMTLAFLGSIEGETEARVIDTMNQLTEEAWWGSLDQLRPLPHAHRFSAISFTLARGQSKAKALIAKYRPLFLAEAGRPPDPREPLPHVIVARLNRRATALERQQALAWMAEVVPPQEDILLDRVALYTWSDDRRRRQFKIIHEIPLGQ